MQVTIGILILIRIHKKVELLETKVKEKFVQIKISFHLNVLDPVVV